MPKLLPVVFVRAANLAIRSFTHLLKVCRNVLVRSLRRSRKHSLNSILKSCDARKNPFLNSISLRINSCFRTIMPLAQRSSRAFLPTFYKNAKEFSSVTRASPTFFLRRARDALRHLSARRAFDEGASDEPVSRARSLLTIASSINRCRRTSRARVEMEQRTSRAD
jgi:hypothetical protein